MASGMASFAQLELIRELWREVHGQAVCNDAGLTGWIRKWFKLEHMRFLTAADAPKVIAALKAIKARPAKAKAA